jgi:hypothetical protein
VPVPGFNQRIPSNAIPDAIGDFLTRPTWGYDTTSVQADLDRRRAQTQQGANGAIFNVPARPSRHDVLESIRRGETNADQHDLAAYGIDPKFAGAITRYGGESRMPTREEILASIRSGETRSYDHDLKALGIEPGGGSGRPGTMEVSPAERIENRMVGWAPRGRDQGGEWRRDAGGAVNAARSQGTQGDVDDIITRLITRRRADAQGAER